MPFFPKQWSLKAYDCVCSRAISLPLIFQLKVLENNFLSFHAVFVCPPKYFDVRLSVNMIFNLRNIGIIHRISYVDVRVCLNFFVVRIFGFLT